jgi:hypothetical protein
MELANREWKDFVIQDLFNIKIGKSIDGNKVNKESGSCAYITRKESENGLDGFIDFDDKLCNKDYPVITIGNETAEPFVQEFPFFTGTKVNILIPKVPLNSKTLFFITTSLKAHKNKYSYSFTINSTRLKRQKILLPVDCKGEPDYVFMGKYMRQKETELLKRYEKQVSDFESIVPLSKKKWKEFKTTDIFNDIQRGKRLKKDDHKSGVMPYVSSTGINNGVDGFVGNEEDVRIFSNCLTIANSGSVGAAFYQPFSFIASDHVTKLENSQFNKYIYLFIADVTSRFTEKYSFNREINDIRIKKEKILLPINSKNEPDYVYMESYMKALESGKIKQYLEHKATHTVR